MSTVPSNTPAQTVEQVVVKAGSTLWEFVGKSSVSLLLVGAIALGVYFVHNKVAEYDAAMAKANADNNVFKTQLKQYQDEQDKDKALISAAQTKTVIIEKQVAANDTKTAATVAAVTKPDETVQQVQAQATQYLPETPTITPDLKLAFTPPTVQLFVANKVELDNTKQDLSDAQQEVKAEQDEVRLYGAEVADANKSLGDAQTTIDAYKKAAKKSIWKKLEGAAIDVGIGVGAYELGKAAAGK